MLLLARIKITNFVAKMDDPNLKKNFDDTTNTKLLEVCLFYFYSSSLKKELIIFGVTCVLGRPCAVRSKIRYLRNLFANYRIPIPNRMGRISGSQTRIPIPKSLIVKTNAQQTVRPWSNF